VAPGGHKVKQLATHREWANAVGESGPRGLAVDGAGNLVVTVPELMADNGSGGVYLQRIAADGAADGVVRLATTAAGTKPGPLALAESGHIYVALTGTGTVAVLKPTGETDSTLQVPPLRTPSAVAFSDVSLLIAEQAPGDPAAGRILSVTVGEHSGKPR
jgi:sugar lactone lactonase YvrE